MPTESLLPIRDELMAMMEDAGVDALGVIDGRVYAVNYVQRGGRAFGAVRDAADIAGMNILLAAHGPEVDLLLRVGAEDADLKRLDFYRYLRERLIASEQNRGDDDTAHADGS